MKSIALLSSLPLALLSGFLQASAVHDESSSLRMRLSVLDPLSIPSVDTVSSDVDVALKYTQVRAKVFERITSEFDVPESVVNQLYGNWSLDRIKQVNKVVFFHNSRSKPRGFLTMDDVARFLPDGWQNSPELVEFLKKIIVSKYVGNLGKNDSRCIYKALGDFSDARIQQFARIVNGEWRRCPVSMEDLCLHLDNNRRDDELRAFFERIAMDRAKDLLGTDKKQIIDFVFEGFNPVRVQNIRDLLLNRWVHHPATMDELSSLFPESLRNDQNLITALEQFRLKTFVVHKVFSIHMKVHELTIHFSLSPDELLTLKLIYICHRSLSALIAQYLNFQKCLPLLEAMPSVSERICSGIAHTDFLFTEADVEAAAEALINEMKLTQPTDTTDTTDSVHPESSVFSSIRSNTNL